MKVDKIHTYNNRLNNTFRSTNRMFFDQMAKKSFCLGKVSNYTEILRGDIDDWFKLAEFIINNFPDKEIINIYSLGCSDGSEAFTLAIALKRFIKNKKVFPIMAVDKDRDIIAHALSERINMSGNDIAKVNEKFGSGQQFFTDIQEGVIIKDKYNTTLNDWDSCIPRYYSLKKNPDLQKLVDFRAENLIVTASKIKDDSNTFVACRNVFPYLSPKEHKLLIYYLKTKLKPNSLVAIGEFDENTNTAQKLICNGFAPTKIKNVFIKL